MRAPYWTTHGLSCDSARATSTGATTAMSAQVIKDIEFVTPHEVARCLLVSELNADQRLRHRCGTFQRFHRHGCRSISYVIASAVPYTFAAFLGPFRGDTILCPAPFQTWVVTLAHATGPQEGTSSQLMRNGVPNSASTVPPRPRDRGPRRRQERRAIPSLIPHY